MFRTVVTTGLLLVLSGPVFAQNGVILPKRGDVPASAGNLNVVLQAITRWSDIPVETAGMNPARFIRPGQINVPFWTALDDLAAATGNRIALGARGQKVAFVRHKGPPAVSSVDGPFRVVVREVVARRDAVTGLVGYEIKLDVHWEPRFPVFRIGDQKTPLAVDDRGTKLIALKDSGKVPAAGYLMQTSVQLTGVPRAATKIAKLEGSFTVTAAEKMIRFVFADDLKAPASKSDSEVTVALAKFTAEDGLWEARVELAYPPGQPVFESYERWFSDNTCRLVDQAGKTFEATDYELPAGGAKLTALYRFKEDPARGLTPGRGWKLEYVTPSPLMEYTVKYSLKDIDLP